MTRYNELAALCKDIKEPKKSIILSLLEDFVFYECEIIKLRAYPRYIIDEKDPRRQKKLDVHSLLMDYQAKKDDIATKILRTLDNDKLGEQSPLLKALAAFEND